MKTYNLSRLRKLLSLSFAIAMLMSSGLVGIPGVKSLESLQMLSATNTNSGAVGFGSNTPGGEGGPVFYISNLNNSGTGSLRDVLENHSGPRKVICNVAEYISLTSPIIIRNPYVTVENCDIRRDHIIIATHDVIIRNSRFRVGDEGGYNSSRDGINISTTYAHSDVYNILIDHCSVSWSMDENVSTWIANDSPYTVHDVTIQWSIISEALHKPLDSQLNSFGLLLGRAGAYNISVHHNLLAHNRGRNPRIDGIAQVEIVNNVIYDWGDIPTEISSAQTSAHVIGNYYKNTQKSSEREIKFYTPSTGTRIFIDGNYVDSHKSRSLDNTKTRYPADDQHAIILQQNSGVVRSWYTSNPPYFKASAKLFNSGLQETDALTAYQDVLSSAGAWPRDSVDARIINETRDRTGLATWVNSQVDVGGWPTDPPTEITPTVTSTASFHPLPGLSWEAEHGEITHPFTVTNGIVSQDVLTSNPVDGGRALYRFTIENPGEYIVKANVNAFDASSNSFFVNIDTEPDTSMIWDIPVTNGFEERFVSWRDGLAPDGTVENTKVFSLASGEHTLIVRGREASVLLDNIEIVNASAPPEPINTSTLLPAATQTFTPTNTPLPPSMTAIPPTQQGNNSPLPGLAWEAEQGEITAPFSVINGIVSQNILTGNPADGGRAFYRFHIQDGGDYIVKALVNAADEGRNSFFVGMDTEPDVSMIWDVPLTNGFEERTVSWRDSSASDENPTSAKVFSLSTGEHTLIIRGREISTLLDKVEISKVSPAPPPATALPTTTQAPTLVPVSTVTSTMTPLLPTPTLPLPTAIPTETSTPEPPTPTETPLPPTPVPPTIIPPTIRPTDDPLVETIFDDTRQDFIFSDWITVRKKQAFGGSYKQTRQDGATATLEFTGKSFSVLYKSGPRYGILNVYVDGALVGSIDQNERPQAFQRIWDYPGQLSPGTHKLTLVFASSNQKGSVDAVIVR